MSGDLHIRQSQQQEVPLLRRYVPPSSSSPRYRMNRIKRWGGRIIYFWILGLLFVNYVHWMLPMEGPITLPVIHTYDSIQANNNNNNQREEGYLLNGEKKNDVVVTNPRGYQQPKIRNIEKLSFKTNDKQERSVVDHEEKTTSSVFTSPLFIFFMIWTFCRVCKFWLVSRLPFIQAGGEYESLRRRRLQRHSLAIAALVDRLNAQRAENGERPVSIETLRLALTHRDFDGNDYDSLLRFQEEMSNGPVVLGATDVEIQRCPERVINNPHDELLLPNIISNTNLSQRTTCTICLESYNLNDRVRTMPCFHTFHSSCIDPWLRNKAECPICKSSAII